jgi:hypothetical protein
MKKGITFNLHVSLEYGEGLTNEEDAIGDLYRALMEAKEAGHFNRQVIEIEFGDYSEVSPYTPWSSEEDE